MEQDITREEVPGEAAVTDSVGDDVLVRIGASLRAQYREILDEPVPERISDLLQQLDEAEQNDITDALPEPPLEDDDGPDAFPEPEEACS